MLRENVVDFIALVEADITRGRIYFIGTIGSVEISISINPWAQPLLAADEVDTAKEGWALLKVVIYGHWIA